MPEIMPDEKKYSILFILNDAIQPIQANLPSICNGLIKAGNDVHVIYSSLNLDENFEISLRKVPWIHAQKLKLSKKFTIAGLGLPLTIRGYIKRHDEIDVIHSFGLNAGILSQLARIGLKTATVNTPDMALPATDSKSKPLKILVKLAIDNINYIYNRLVGKILFISENDKNLAAQHPSYRNIAGDVINLEENEKELGYKLSQLYDQAIIKIK